PPDQWARRLAERVARPPQARPTQRLAAPPRPRPDRQLTARNRHAEAVAVLPVISHTDAPTVQRAVISIGKLRSADYYEREVVEGAEDYYVRPGEAPGRWVGNLAAEMNLEGTVDGDQLAALFDLRHPHTGERLLDTNATKPGFDLTISAPKSV